MSSSDPAAAEPPRISRYAFQQLERPEHGPVGGAADVLSAAWEEADQVRAQARLAGESEGRAEGLAAAIAQAAPALAALEQAVRSFEQLRGELVDTLEQEAADLALRIAEQIVAGALDVQPARIVDIARGALRRVAERQRVTLVVNPRDLDLLSESLERLRTELGGIEHLDVQADRRIDLGGAVLRTEYGEVDTTVSTQLQRAREIVSAAMRREERNQSEGSEHA
ncbi:MAG: FliH/SctL family protein [Solirubrobacteraceae bacterium]